MVQQRIAQPTANEHRIRRGQARQRLWCGQTRQRLWCPALNDPQPINAQRGGIGLDQIDAVCARLYRDRLRRGMAQQPFDAYTARPATDIPQRLCRTRGQRRQGQRPHRAFGDHAIGVE
jgi:hypothetical protein